MDPVSISLALASLLGGLHSSTAATGTARENLDFQRAEAARQYRLSTAGRTDAYGNRLGYNEATNEWTPTLTPEQKALTLAGEREQRLGLTEDAARNRRVRSRAEGRGIQAGDAYDQALAGYRYKQPPGEDAIRSDIMRLILQSYGTGDRALAKMVDSQALRQQGNLPVINTGIPKVDPGARLAQVMLQARSQGVQESQSRRQAHNQEYLPAISEFNKIAGQGGDAQFGFPTTAHDMDAKTQAAIQGVQQAMQSGAGGVNAASGALTTASGKNPVDLRGIASLLSRGRAGTNTRSDNTRVTGQGSGDWTNPDSITPINSGTSYTMPPVIPGRGTTQNLEPWFQSTASVPGDSWYF